MIEIDRLSAPGKEKDLEIMRSTLAKEDDEVS